MVDRNPPSGWKVMTLGDIGDIVTGKTPSTEIREYFDGDVPFVTPSDMDGRKVISRTERYLTQLGADSVKSGRVPGGAVMVSCIGSDMGKAAVAGCNCVTNQQINSIIVDRTRFCPDYVYYNLSTRKAELQSLAGGGSAQPILNKGHFSVLRIAVPPLPEQRAIAHILGTLDDKIDLNRRMNETLEAMARAIFKSWFMDFDPVRAKAEGCQPFGMDAATAALFPDSFQDSPLGKTPRGWRVSRIGNELNPILGGTPSRSHSAYWSGGTVPWINSGKVNEFRIIEPSEYITEEAVAKSATKLLPQRTTVLAITGATLGQVSLLEIESCANQSVVGIVGSTAIPSEFVYFWVKSRIDDLVSWQTGGAQQHINKNNVNDLIMLCPDPRVLGAYKRIAKPFFDAIRVCCFENLTLAAIRDALLPKLISGEIRVRDTEKYVGKQA
jgi:type I restriction enzyme S subunit